MKHDIQQCDMLLDCLCAADPHVEWSATAWVFLKQILEQYFKVEHDINSLFHTWDQTQLSYVTKYTEFSLCQYVSLSASHWATVTQLKGRPRTCYSGVLRLNNVVLPIPQVLNQLMLCVWRYKILVNKSFQGLWMVMRSGTLTSNVKWVIIIQRQSVQYGEEPQATSAVMAHSNLQHVIKEGNGFHNSHLCHVTACDLRCFLYQLSAGVNHLNSA